MKVMEMFKIMTGGIKAIHVQDHSVLEQLTDHTVAHCDNVVAYLLLLLWSVLKFIFCEPHQKGVLSDKRADHCTSPLCLLHLTGYNIICSFNHY